MFRLGSILLHCAVPVVLLGAAVAFLLAGDGDGLGWGLIVLALAYIVARAGAREEDAPTAERWRSSASAPHGVVRRGWGRHDAA
jgi:hypothetical protein